MLIPTKHEMLKNNTLVIGANLITILKKNTYNIETLFQKIKKQNDISIDLFYNTLLFLWLSELIELEEDFIILKVNKNVFE